MDLIGHLLSPPRRAGYAPWDDFWYNPLGHNADTNAGIPIDRDAASRIAAVYCARSILSETLAHVPLKTHRRLDRGKEVWKQHPLYRVLHDRANSIQTSMEWREQQMGDLVFRGNCYSEKVFREGLVTELRPLPVDRVKPLRLPNFRIGYTYRDENNRAISYVQQEVLHVRGYSSDGFTGLAPLDAMRESLGHTTALEIFGARLFRDGANHDAVYEHPGSLSQPAYERLKTDLAQASGWSSAHGTRILEEGMKISKTNMTAEQAQFLLSRKFQIAEIARWFHIPPHLLGDLEKASFSNIEQQSLEFVIYTMVPWFVRWEQRLNADLMLSPETYFVEFNVDGLLRGDIKSRYEAYKVGIETGFLTRNEARDKESLNAAPGLDKFLVMQNMAMIDEQGKAIPINKPEAPATNGGFDESDNDAMLRRLLYSDAEIASDGLDKEILEQLDYSRRVVAASAERVIRKEAGAVMKALARYNGDARDMEKWAEKFYHDQARFIADVMAIDPEKAEKFAAHQKNRLLVSLKDNCAADLLKEMEAKGAEYVLAHLREAATNGHRDAR